MNAVRQSHNLIQGSPEWDAFRLEHFGASEAAPMLGLSKNVTRTELLDAKKTGVAKQFSEFVQKRILDPGHEVEALARPIVEEMIGDELGPVTYSFGILSASCDGINFDETVGFEHKQWNEELAGLVSQGIVPDTHMPQCQQILLVTGAEKLIFVVSNGTREKMVWTWVKPSQEWFERIKAGWAQFAKDLETHEPKVIAEQPKPEIVIELPALYVHAKGEITTSNMKEYGDALVQRLKEVRAIALVTDQDFANAKGAAKLFREQVEKLKQAKEAMLSQTVSIGEAARMIDAWTKDLQATALQLEKDVEREDLAKKRAMIDAGSVDFTEHVAALEAEIKPIRLNIAMPNFAVEIKCKRNYASMQNAIDTALANAKVEADLIAQDIRSKLAWCKDNADGYGFLFADLQQIIFKPADDFQLLITSRIEQHKKEEDARLEAERERIRKEEEAKVKAAAEAEATKSQQAIATPDPMPQVAVQEAQLEVSVLPGAEELARSGVITAARFFSTAVPTTLDMVHAVAVGFQVSDETALGWLKVADFNIELKKAA
jgi:predicted phage-related endonuclease